jgi:hypothetical protein
MNRLQIPHGSDLPGDFLQRFWFEQGDNFVSFLSRCRSHHLLFALEVPSEGDNNNALLDAIDGHLQTLGSRDGPKLPLPDQGRDLGVHESRLWEFLSCKEVKVKMKDLRGRRGAERRSVVKIPCVEIARSSGVLAPIDYNAKSVAKRLGYPNPLREVSTEPEDLVVIGIQTISIYSFSAQRYPLNRC